MVDAPSQKHATALPHRILSPFWLLSFFAALLLSVAIWGAGWQPPHLDAYRLASTPFDPDYWLYPREDNAFRRLPVINSNLNDVFVLPGSRQVWAVGNDGLIIHSDDGGLSWERQTVGQVPQPARSSAIGLDFFKSAWAGEQPVDKADLSTKKTADKAATKQATVDQTERSLQASKQEQQHEQNSTVPSDDSGASKQPDMRDDRFRANLQSVFFSDSHHGWAVGASEVIIATNDGGHSWQQQYGGAKSWLYGVHFNDNLHGWAVGASGVILATADGGHSWQQQNSGIKSSLSDVFFSDSLHGRTVGEVGVILATADGGQSWQRQDSGVNSNLSGVYFSDNLHGWVIGERGVILFTPDGGQSWRPQSSSVESRLTSVYFSDNLHGWTVGLRGEILITEDGGQNWRRQSNGIKSSLMSVYFSNNTHGWAVGEGGVILASDDGGQSWHRQSSDDAAWLGSVHFSDNTHGWAVGFSGAILATDDGGQCWRRQRGGVELELFGVHFSDSLHGWAVGYDGVILASTDGGQSWQRQSSGVASSLWGVHFSDNLHGWAVGSDGVILATADGGQNWQRQSSGGKPDLYRVHFSDSLHGWAVGDGGVILGTADSGQSWQWQTSDVNSNLSDVHFSDSLHGWAVGFGVILATADGGQSWQRQSSGEESWLFGVHFSDSLHGWAVGYGGVILATVDGGRSWRSQISGVDSKLTSVHFIDSLHGWIVGSNDVILSTADGGQHWQQPGYRRYPAPWVYAVLLLAIAAASLAVWQPVRQRKPVERHKSVMDRAVTDKPAGPYAGSPDLLGARKLAMGLVRFLTNKNTNPPITIAITGEWGSGKSSVMNFLFAGLKRQGLTPVWFNAWHHREEQNVLASVLINIHKQVIGPWWAPAGFWFRLRLLWLHNFFVKLLLSTLAFALMFSGIWLYNHPDGRNALWQYASYRLGIFDPLILTQHGYDQLCVSQTNPALFSEAQCAKLADLVSRAEQHREVLKCGDTMPANCFARPQLLLKAAEDLLAAQLTVESETALLKQVEHLHPDFPLPLPPALAKWLSVLMAVLSFFALKGMALVGLAPAKIVQSVLSLAGSQPAPGEPVGTRILFEKHFKQITDILGKRRLVLFIDDLDRCDREHTRQVLELTNFLSGASELFIILGMAPRYVLANVTLSFQDMAKAVNEADGMNDQSAKDKNTGQSWYARHYLQKLIHIEVPVPTPEKSQVQALLHGNSESENRDAEEIQLEKLEQAEQRLDQVKKFIWRSLTMLLLLTAAMLGGLWGAGVLQPISFEQAAAPEPAKASADTSRTEPSSAREGVKASDKPDQDKSASAGNGFVAGAKLANYPLLQLWPFAVLLVMLFMLTSLARNPKILDNRWLSWLQPLYQRLKLQITGVELREDSATFADALDIWYELIALSNPIPRNVKAFLNQLRYFASREFSGEREDRREAQWVALAVAFYAFGNDMDKVFAVETGQESQRWHFLDKTFERKLQERGLADALSRALDVHRQKFHQFPSEADLARFKGFSREISIQKRVPKA
ncbi:YCF48-related protein [Methylomonas sp. MgM2]